MTCAARMEVKRKGMTVGARTVYLHQSKREEGCEGPVQESRAHLAVGCWRPGEKEWKPLRRKCGGKRGREGQSQEVIGQLGLSTSEESAIRFFAFLG